MSLTHNSKEIMWRASALCLGLSLPSILIGNAVMVGLVLLGALFGIIATNGNSLRSSLKLVATSFVARIVGVVLFVLMMGSLMSANIPHAMDQLGEVALVAFVATCLFVLLREMPSHHTRLLVNILSLGTLTVMALALLDLLVDNTQLATAIHGEKTFSDRYLDDMLSPERYHFLSGILVVIVPFLWVWLVKLNQERLVGSHWLAFPLAAFTAIVIFVTGGAAGVVALILSGIFFLAIAADHHWLVIHKRHWSWIIGTVIIAPLLYWLANGVWPSLPAIPALELKEMNWQYILADPVYGSGLGNLSAMARIVLDQTPMIIRLLAEVGIVALLLIVFLAVYLLLMFYRFARNELYGLAGFTSLMAFLTMSVLDTYLFNAWWLTLGIFPLLLAGRIGWSWRK